MSATSARRRYVAPRGRSVLAWCWFSFVVALALELAGLAIANRAVYSAGNWMGFPFLALASVVWAAIGAVIVTRTGNLVGWTLLAVATAMAGAPAAEQYIMFGLVTSPGSLPLTGLAARLGPATMVLLWGIGLLFLVFPTGRPLTPRWRPVAWAFAAAMVLHGVGWQIRLDDSGKELLPGPWTERGVFLANRFAMPGLDWVWQAGVAIGLVASGLAIASLVIRVRRASGEERAQLRWLSFVGIVVALVFLASLVPGLRESPISFPLLFFCILFGIPTACGIAVLKYHLYEIDVVISKTIVYGVLVLFTTIVYVVLVLVVGRAIGVGSTSLPLSIAATAVVAVAFQPLRERTQRVANRVVYGKRATPYEVLARFSDRIGEAYATEDLLPRTARVLAEGVHAARAVVWLRLGDRFEPSAVWPPDARDGLAPVTVPEDGSAPVVPGDHVAPVRYQDHLLGALAVDEPRDEPIATDEIELLDDLASQAGLVLSNVRMTADLEARLTLIQRRAAALRASRQRIVAAQDAERRRLERNIHDGAQQHLVALAVKLRLVQGLVQKDPTRARAMLAELRAEVEEALETLRTLSLGIYPPLLEEQGIAAALSAQLARSGLPVRIHADRLGRHPIEIEAAVYFCIGEALQNAAKYAHASAIAVVLDERDGAVEFEVRDDGVGFDPSANGNGTGLAGMRDRLAVLGGDAELLSAPDRGTVVRGRVPLAAAEVVT